LPVADQLGVVLLIGLDIQIADIVALVHKGRRFDEEDIDADTVAGAAPDGFPELGQMHVGAAAKAGQNRNRHRIAERNRQPQGVDAFVGQPVQVFVRVVVDLVFQLVPVHRRPLDRAEKAAGEPRFNEGLLLRKTQGQHWCAGCQDEVLQLHDAAPDAFRVCGFEPDAVRADQETKGLRTIRFGLSDLQGNRRRILAGSQVHDRAKTGEIRPGRLQETGRIGEILVQNEAPGQRQLVAAGWPQLPESWLLLVDGLLQFVDKGPGRFFHTRPLFCQRHFG